MTRRKRPSRHHRRRRHILGRGYFTRIGPGIVTGAADDDPSGIGTYSQVGAAYGLGLLWSLPFVAPMAAAVQENVARLALTTEKGFATLIRERFPRPVLFGALALTIAANTFNIAADVGSMAATTRLVIDIPAVLLIIFFTGGMAALAVLVRYHRYAPILRVLVLSLLAYPIVLITVHVNWSAVLDKAFVPKFVGGAAGLGALIAIFGTTVSPYLFFWQASEEIEEEEERNELGKPPTRAQIRAMRRDVVGGMVSAVAIAFVIVIVTASTLHSKGVTTVATAQQAANALKPVAGDLAGFVFAVGIVGVGLLAVPVLAGSSAYALSEAFRWNEGLSRPFRQARGFYLVLIGSMLAGIVIDVSGLDAIRALYFAAILNGVAAPPLIILMTVLGRDRRVMGSHRSGWLSLTVLVLTIGVSVAAPIAYLVSS